MDSFYYINIFLSIFLIGYLLYIFVSIFYFKKKLMDIFTFKKNKEYLKEENK